MAGQQQRDVGQRADRDQRDRLLGAAQQVGEQFDGTARIQWAGRGQGVGATAETVLVVPLTGPLRLGEHQWALGTGGHRHVGAAGQGEQPARVGRGGLQPDVAEHRAHPE
ncbi:MAG: hypothetical protein QOF38_1854 [Pseudonocardiales bacterium]|nr:hypothetical protein [Pseudonocardiales bacterium]